MRFSSIRQGSPSCRCALEALQKYVVHSLLWETTTERFQTQLLEWEGINAGSREVYPNVYPHLFSWDLALLPRHRYVRVNWPVIVFVQR
jgi:hypothetical protein